MRLRGGIAVVCSMLAAACGGLETDGVGKTASEADLVTDTCTNAEFDGNLCAGVWQYPDRCCAVGYTAYQSCPVSHRFADYTFQQLVTFPPGPCSQECDTIPGKCITVCDPGNPDCGPTTATALQNVTSVYNSCIKDPPWPAPVVKSTSFTLKTTSSGWCTAVIANAPVSGSGVVNSCAPTPDPLCDGLPGSEKLGACVGLQPAYPAGGVPAQGVATGKVNPDRTQEKQMKAQCPGLWVYSSPGKTVGQLPAGNLPPSPTADPPDLNTYWNNTAPTCLSCEPTGYPMNTATADTLKAAVQAKFKCLNDNLASVPPGALAKDPQMKSTLVKHAEVLFEKYGEMLTPDQFAKAESLYTDWQGVVPGCSEPPDTALPAPNASGCNPPSPNPATPPPDPTTRVLDGKLKMCDRLRDFHSSLAVAQSEVANCIDAWSVMPASCSAKSAYGAAYSEISTEILRKAFSSFTPSDPAARQSGLRDRMSKTHRWYENRKAAAAVQVPTDAKPATTIRAQLMRDSEIVAGSIIKGAYANRLAATSSLALTQRNAFVLDAAKDDQELLGVLLPPGDLVTGARAAPPLTNGPALWILAHTLQPTAQRIGELDVLHDLGCDFRVCKAPGAAPLSTKLTQMHASLAALPAASTLQTATRDLLGAPWKDMFDNNILGNHAGVFQAAVRDVRNVPDPAGYDPTLVTSATEADGPVYAVAAIVRDSSTKMDNYKATGRLRPGDKDPVYTGLLSRKLDDTIALVDRAKAALNDAKTRFETNWLTELSTSVQLVGAGDQLLNAQNELKTKGALLKQYLEQIDGLRTAATVDLERLGDFTRSYDAFVKSRELADVQQYITRASSGVLSITPAHARYTGSSNAVADVSVVLGGAPFKMSASPKDLVRIETSGAWSPTCAIAAYASKNDPRRAVGISTMLKTVVEKTPITPPLDGFLGAKTGPQGYGLTFSGSTYQVHGTVDPDFNLWNYVPAAGSAGGAVIGGVIGSAGGPAGAVVGATIGGEIGRIGGSIISGIFGGDTQTSDSSGTEKRQTAAFNAGLRVPTAPYPGFPAGALLAVKVGAIGNTIDVEVVQAPSTTLVIDQPTDVYLVVNDAVCDRTIDPVTLLPVDLGGLAVELIKLTSPASFALQLQSAITKTYTFVQDETKRILPLGVVLPSDLSGIRSQAMLFLTTECRCDLTTNFDRSLMTFFSAFVDTALNQVERQVEIGRLERQVRILSMEFDALAAHVIGLDRQSQVLSLLPAWAAKNIDEDRLRLQTRDLVSSVERYLYPFARAKYPEVLSGSTGFSGLQANGALFDPLTVSLDWNTDWGKIADSTISVVSTVEGKFIDARVAFDQFDVSGRPVTQTIGIAIPKPESRWTEFMRTIPGTYAHTYRDLSPSDSETIWAAIQEGRPAEITISPDDLYRRFSEPALNGQLDCTRMVPVVQSAALYAVDDGNTVNEPLNHQIGHNVITFSSDELMFGTASGPVALMGSNPSWLSFSLPILYGPEPDALKNYTTLPLGAPAANAGAGQGLSAFGKFTLSADRDHLDRQSVFALILLMTVEYRNNTNGATASWLTHCQ